ncbi:MAG TPA: fatty acid desaturase [Candidatus Bathyarchaeia archaeon]|nr:fatty acid desaturase [Candidatus Bathyarchaeia archaeon]
MTSSTKSCHERHPVQHYAREVRAHLPAEFFRPASGRLVWLPVHLAIVVAAGACVVVARPPWYAALACALVAGHSWGCLGFLAHEALHHALVRNRKLEKVVGYLGFGIMCLSPTLWTAWHNQAHHGNTGKPIADPDGFGRLGFWRKSALVRVLEGLSPGSGNKRSALFLCIWFSLHSFLVLVFHSERNGYYTRISRRTVYLESGSMVAFWLALLALVGPWSFLFIYVLPLAIANGLVMSYIATNHFLNPLTEINDPLANSLSVTSPRWLARLHLEFGYHVEHHLFPTLSGRHAPAVRDVLIRLYGERYLSMPHARALRLLYTRPKLHDGYDTLIDPRTMGSFHVLAPGDLSMSAIAAAN